MGGRAAAPTSVKKAMGVRPARINDDEPVPPPGVPLPPSYIFKDPVALEQWNQIVPILDEMGVLSQADILTLGILCRSYAQMLLAIEKLATEDYLIKGSRGLVPNPYIKVEQDARNTILRIANEYGLTAVARSRISVVGKDKTPKAGGLAEFLASSPRYRGPE